MRSLNNGYTMCIARGLSPFMHHVHPRTGKGRDSAVVNNINQQIQPGGGLLLGFLMLLTMHSQ